jgi:hypothetical protein
MYSSRRPIAGLKMGSQASKISRDTVLAFGEIPTIVPANALYTSLQTNLLDGASSSLADLFDLKIYQVTVQPLARFLLGWTCTPLFTRRQFNDTRPDRGANEVRIESG